MDAWCDGDFSDFKMLWLRYLSGIQKGQDMIDQELLSELQAVPEIAEALELAKESRYNKAELEAYDKFWDQISTDRTLIADAEAKGRQEGREEGREEGEQIGMQKGEQIGIQKKEIEVILALYEDKFPIESIAKYAKLSEEDVAKILRQHGKIS